MPGYLVFVRLRQTGIIIDLSVVFTNIVCHIPEIDYIM
jgi:hypothetical protein